MRKLLLTSNKNKYYFVTIYVYLLCYYNLTIYVLNLNIITMF